MDLTHPDIASETLEAVNGATGLPCPETDTASADRSRLIHAAVENGLLALIKARWPRPDEVTLREVVPAGGVAVTVAGVLPPEEGEPGLLRLRAGIAGRSSLESFRSDFCRLLAEFPFIGGEVSTSAGSGIEFGLLSAERGGELKESRENGIPVVSAAAELTLRIDLANSEFAEAEYPAEESDLFESLRNAWAALSPGYAWAALAQLLRQRSGLSAEAVPADSFRDCCSLQLATAEPLTDAAVRRFRFTLEAGSANPAQLREQLALLAGALPVSDETVTLTSGSSIRFRMVSGKELSCRLLRYWGRPRLEGKMEIVVELDTAACVPVAGDLPGEPVLPARPAFDFGALERALDELFLAKLAFDGAVVLNNSGQLLTGKPWGCRFSHFESDASGRMTTLFFRVEWGELKREAALTQLARLERLFPLYDCGLGDVTAAALLMESNRSASEQMEQTEVTSGTVVLRACIVH